MYQITTASGVIGYTEAPEYCYRLCSGSPQVLRPRDKAKATGIVFGGTVYNLPGHDEFPDTETAAVSEVDAGAALNRQQAEITELAVENSTLKDALCEQDTDVSAQLTEIKDALCELDKEVSQL